MSLEAERLNIGGSCLGKKSEKENRAKNCGL